jgi:hypothetical protein
MKTHFITYSDKNFENQKTSLVNYASKLFDVSQGYSREWLESTDFYLKNKLLLDNPKGVGFWIWKPFIILDKLNSINDGDIVFYLDAADVFTSEFPSFLKNYFTTNDIDCMLTYGGQNKQKWYTKKDTFYLMGCDNEMYHEHLQLEAGILVFKNTPKIREIVKEWLYYCTIDNIISDIPNIHGENYDGFIRHNSDQSVLSNLAIKYNLNMNNLSRRFVTCNVNQ